MRIYSALVLLALFGTAYTHELFGGKGARREVRKNTFGHYEIVDYNEDSVAKDILISGVNYVRDYAAQTQFLQDAIKQIQVNTENMKNGKVYTCSEKGSADPDPTLEFFPIFVGDLGGLKTHEITYTQGKCFSDIQFEYSSVANGKDIQEVMVTITTSGAKSLLCHDIFLFGTTEFTHVEDVFFSGKTTLTFKNLNSDAVEDIGRNGIKVYMFCGGYIETFVAVWKTLLAFVGGLTPDPDTPIIGSHVPPYMEKANIDFLKASMHYNMEERPVHEVEIDESYIQSGDFFAIMRLDGLDPMIMYGTGSHVGHTVMALRMDGELYIIESQDGWYWPFSGIQKNKFSDWIKYAKAASFHVVHMPLNTQMRAKFNETAAIKFFQETEGLPYGYHNFLFGWIDTPEANFPPLIPPKLMPILFSMLEGIVPDVMSTFYTQALNHRLGTKGLNIADLSKAAAERNMTLMQVQAMPEIEGWMYEGLEPRDGRAYVCSAYVTAVYKRAGLFDDHEINAPEFTPRDIYTLNFWNTTGPRPDACVKADPDAPFCQLLGKYRMTFPGLNTISPYSDMAQSCPSQPPLYERPADC